MSSEDLILRDHLAVGRTELANERALLSYARTALAVFAGSVTLIHFFESSVLAAGWLLMPVRARRRWPSVPFVSDE